MDWGAYSCSQLHYVARLCVSVLMVYVFVYSYYAVQYLNLTADWMVEVEQACKLLILNAL